MRIIVTAKEKSKSKKVNKEKLKKYWSVLFPDDFVDALVENKKQNSKE